PDIMIIGRNPGNKEVANAKPFSGQSGVKLDQWLELIGKPKDSPREGVYITSILKCFCPEKESTLRSMYLNCNQFLINQYAILQPKLVITLGKSAFDAINFTSLNFKDAVGLIFNSAEYELIPKLGIAFDLLVWPHPSGLSRWFH